MRDVEEMLEDGLDEEPVTSMKDVVCVMCGFECSCKITLKKHTKTQHGDLPKDNNEKKKTENMETNYLEDYFQIEFVKGKTVFLPALSAMRALII